jgi:ATP-binding cassette subfamily F protein uup
MQYLSVENASKSYGENVLFSNANFTISKGDKIALIAKNGSGKTTLLKVISGEENVEGENAKIEIAKHIKIAYLKQEPELHPKDTVLEAIFDAANKKMNAVKEYKIAMLSDDKEAQQKALLAMDDEVAWDTDAMVSTVMNKLRIDYPDKLIENLSGGQRKRVALARIILEYPDFIILDEPTNHLDIDMIEWLEDYLANANITVFMVTHDRYFLENVCNEIMELDKGMIHIYRGNYSQYLEKKEMRLQNEAANFDKTRKLFKRELEWVRRQPQARGTKAKSRVDKFYEIKKEISSHQNDSEMSINIDMTRLGSKIVEAHNISKSYGELKLFENFSYKFKKGERVGVVGINGAGKSTFIKVLTGEVPTDTGKVVIGETVVFGHYNQEGLMLNKDKTVIDVIRDIADYIPLAKGLKLSAESLLERFLFPRSQQRVYVSQLSGGEKRRLYLLTVLIKNPNFLILDEPTNDLDIITLNVLEDYLVDYPGCLIIISHDRFFMDKLVDHIFVLEGDGKIKDFNGTYSEYRNKKKLEQENPASSTEIKQPAESSKSKNDYELRKEVKSIEKQIEKLENKKSELMFKFSDAANLSNDELAKLGKELDEIKSNIEEKEMVWLELSENLDS